MTTDAFFIDETLPEGSAAEFRFLITDPCQGFRIRIHLHYGQYVFYLKHGEPATPSNYDISIISAGEPFDYFLCPSADLFRLGTWFITIRGNAHNGKTNKIAVYAVSFDIAVDLHSLPTVATSAPACTLPSEYQSTHTCLQDSIPYTQTCNNGGYPFPRKKHIFTL